MALEACYLSVSVDGEDKGFLWPEESLAISAGSQVEIDLIGLFYRIPFDGWAVEGIDPAQIPDVVEITFTMPEGDVGLTTKVRELENPETSIDDNGILTWNAVEGYESAAWIFVDREGIRSPLLESGRTAAENGNIPSTWKPPCSSTKRQTALLAALN